MRNRQQALALSLLATTALSVGVVVAAAVAATVNDYYGRWSKADCAEEWVQFADGKVSQFSNRFQPVETAESPSAAAARRPAPAPAPTTAAPKPAEPAKPATAAATDDQPRNPATARRLVNNPNEQPRNPATARKIAPDPKPTPPAAAKAPADAKAPAKPAEPAKPAAATAPAKPAAKGKTMDLPGTIKMDGDNLSVETQERGRKPRREVYRVVDKDTLVLDATFVDGRRIPPITRDAVTYRRCK